MREFIPNVTTIGLLVNPVNPTAELQTREVQEAARALGRQIVVVNASSEDEFETAFARLVQLGAGALLVAAEPIFESWRDRIVALTARHAVPAIYQARESVVAGGLMSYGPSFADAVRQAGIYVGRILTGEKPADLPVPVRGAAAFAFCQPVQIDDEGSL